MKLLNVAGCSLGHSACRSLSKFMLDCCTLSHLDVSHCRISFQGSRYLIDALNRNTTIQNFNFSHNDLTSASFEFSIKVASIVTRHPSLMHLDDAPLTLVPQEIVAARGRQLGFWGGETLVDERILRAVARVQGLLPGSAELRWKSVEGQLYQGLQFERLTYTDGELRIEAATLGFKVSLSPLLYRKLYLKQINATHVRIDLPKDDTPFELPRWPESLPTLDLPLAIQAQRIEISDIRLLREHKPVYALETLKGGLRMSSGALQLNDINAESTDGTLHLNGSYLPGKGYKTRLTGSVKIKTADSGSPSLLLKAEGDAKQPADQEHPPMLRKKVRHFPTPRLFLGRSGASGRS